MDPILRGLFGFAKQIATKAVEGATESVLDDVQTRVREIDEHISSARKRAKARTRERKSSTATPRREREVVDVEFVEEGDSRH